ncbi:Monocopper oxidase-like protein SKU5 isoform C [Glycine soja]|uniref:Monocopper oxidase-like protein SKU5 isoform A n=1 Tax=Glycine soja TaxID=3848 RepID=A0A445FSS2_GLYSO|nr:Monocopper oxidase-like protein SKU5 isoform A [Glycine soja]RZB51874.1 Monocopper oxidase-like protein SKU5 isoform B [Glycine soja]RZB51875.1 Monocopper oxidase-like protein SKU5 isoform C [Glycine soja]
MQKHDAWVGESYELNKMRKVEFKFDQEQSPIREQQKLPELFHHQHGLDGGIANPNSSQERELAQNDVVIVKERKKEGNGYFLQRNQDWIWFWRRLRFRYSRGFRRSTVQQRRTSWQDGILGTNYPIPAKWNWTYQFQVKDQTESFFYFPSLHLQRVVGGFGGFIIINNRPIILIPFDTPYGDLLFSLEIGTPAIIYQILNGVNVLFPIWKFEGCDKLVNF